MKNPIIFFSRIWKWLTKNEPFVLGLYVSIFVDRLEELALLKLLRRLRCFDNDRVTDLWVLINFLISLVFWLALSPFHGYWRWILLYPGWRILGLMIYYMNVLLFRAYHRAKKSQKDYVRSYHRIVLLLIHNYVEILFWYAAGYRTFNYLFCSKHVSLDSIWGSLYFSVVTMSTLGYGDIYPTNTWGLIFIISQTLIGIFLILLLLTRFIAYLPKPRTHDRFEKKMSSGPADWERRKNGRGKRGKKQ